MYNIEQGKKFEEQTSTPEGTATWKNQLDKFAKGNPSEWVTGAVFGGTYERDGLELRDRQMLTMAALAAMGGVEPQLTGHIATAYKHAGLSKEQIAECFIHLMPYIGVPKTLAAMRCMEAALGGEDD
ncbi:carboxymuconolactone decarboxylase family protein [Trueperella bialowiezensis]|uniref:4-carboxymuconolactone decarboxylase n=1 Tax=Trueperella bialowiezensis TaxID=312285 RepID=A0A3S4YWY0_9ACTO|nr:carboxymuconolactone decarboxylase family protein [Trueperella bialowiezensis]VEI12656.1 4-carboxymuconolactone decarboxylase [Trueperella bialowiezensis]